MVRQVAPSSMEKLLAHHILPPPLSVRALQKGDDVCLVHALCAIVHLLSRCRPTLAAKHLTPFVGSRMRLRPRHRGGEGNGHRGRDHQGGGDSGSGREGGAGVQMQVGGDEAGAEGADRAAGGGEESDSEEAVVWVHRQLLLLLRRCLSRAAELRLPRLVVATRLILARFSIEVQK